jgi:hypothetical protein
MGAKSFTVERDDLRTTYELVIHYDELIEFFISGDTDCPKGTDGFTFLEDSCIERPVLDIIVRDTDAADTLIKKEVVAPTDKVVFRFKLRTETVTTTEVCPFVEMVGCSAMTLEGTVP